ncbi:hypothetical protein KKF09_01240 [Patescibacteria group bacterium]|nr:hypothetical protein [Patescibacteria group bacterium]
MTSKNYYGIDLILTEDDSFRIIDIHGLSDAVSFSEKAGYHPRLERIYRFMDKLTDIRQDDKPILYIFSNTPNMPFILPDSVNNFLNSLPEGVANLGWTEKLKNYYESLKNNKNGLFKKEIQLLNKAAKMKEIDFRIGELLMYNKEGIVFNHWNIKDWSSVTETISFEDVGLLVNWGHDFATHPKTNFFWKGEPEKILFPVLNSVQAHYVLNTTTPKWIPNLFLQFVEGIMSKQIIPRQTYLGMGLSSYSQLKEFAETLSKENIVAVTKPLFAHHGVDHSFLTKKDVDKLILSEKNLERELPEIRERIMEATTKGFKYTKKDSKKNALEWYFVNAEKLRDYPVAAIGSYILQEYINPKPVLSQKTGVLHQGTIRAQILNGETITVMHRFPEQPYQKDETINMTHKNVRTFFERADDELEIKVSEYLIPILENFEKYIEKLSCLKLDYINQYLLEEEFKKN